MKHILVKDMNYASSALCEGFEIESIERGVGKSAPYIFVFKHDPELVEIFNAVKLRQKSYEVNRLSQALKLCKTFIEQARRRGL